MISGIPDLEERLRGAQLGRDLRALELKWIRNTDRGWAKWLRWSRKRIAEVRAETMSKTLDSVDKIRRQRRMRK